MTIWYDATTSMRATSRNGIANVEWSIGEGLRAGGDVRFFASRARHGLVEIDPDTDLAAAFYASDPVDAPLTVTVAAPTWRDRVRGLLRDTLGPRSTPVIRTISAVYQAPKQVRRRLSRAGRAGAAPTPAVRLRDVVGPGDVVVSMGAEWEGKLASELADLRARTGCRVVTMVYDLIPLTHTHLAFHKEPDLFERYYTSLLGCSDLITCISEQSRQDLLRFAADRGLTVPRTEVLYLGEHLPDAPPGVARDGDFFLWVGTVERRKNLDLVFDALRILESEGARLPTVVVAGATGWGVSDLLNELALQSTAASRAIVMLGPVDDATLDRLYRRARALLFPSHYEGWGLPIREAAVRGCPVAAGDSPAVREAVAGYAGATLLPTDDPDPWARFLADPIEPVAPAPVRPWSATVADLLAFVRDL